MTIAEEISLTRPIPLLFTTCSDSQWSQLNTDAVYDMLKNRQSRRPIAVKLRWSRLHWSRVLEFAGLNSLVTLNVENYDVSHDCIDTLVTTLCDRSIRTLSLNACGIGVCGAHHIAAFLKRNSTLTSLHLLTNNLKDNGVTKIASSLEHNNTLHMLDLSSNNISNAGAIQMANILPTCTLKRIKLSWNFIGDNGATCIASGVATNTTLTTLDLYRNRIGDQGAIAFRDALATNKVLLELRLSSNKITDEGAFAIATGMAQNKTIQKLTLRAGNRIQYVPEIESETRIL